MKNYKSLVIWVLAIICMILVGTTRVVADTSSNLLQRLEILENRVSLLENRQTISSQSTHQLNQFTGTGRSQTSTFQSNHSPLTINWSTVSKLSPDEFTGFGIVICNPANGDYNYHNGFKNVAGYSLTVSGSSSGQLTSYIPAGTYYLFIEAPYWLQWTVDVN